MKIDAAHRGDDEHQEEEEQQRHRREEADPACERSGLQLLRQDHSDAVAGDQVRVLPPDKIDFSMDTEQINGGRNTWEQAFFCRVLLIFYLTLAISVLIVWFVL